MKTEADAVIVQVPNDYTQDDLDQLAHEIARDYPRVKITPVVSNDGFGHTTWFHDRAVGDHDS